MKEYEYCKRRLRQEEEAARSASCAAARERHEELAEAYRLRTLLAIERLQSRQAFDELPRVDRALVSPAGFEPATY